MTRDRWKLIKSNLCFSGPEPNMPPNDPARDKMYRVRELLTQFVTTSKKLMRPGRVVAMDEAMVKCTGQCVLVCCVLPLPWH
jgi:hypothetical protein